MRTIVINLEGQPSRWQGVCASFELAGLRAERHAAVAGGALDAHARMALYSESLNRRSYHKPLRDGEIGCYASHLQVWAAMLESGEDMLAVFEDDVVVDDDLSAVLRAVEASRVPFDVLKLIGRKREKVAERAPLCPGRELIAYSRVPSLTGAYVLRTSGARKLLAARRPFGRPVDVDIRHWWECDLEVLGVQPYPVGGSPLSDVSTIGSRSDAARMRSRPKKLYLQARYSWLNMQASVARGPRFASIAEAHAHGSTKGATNDAKDASREREDATARAVPATAPRQRRRNLVVLRAGDESLHRTWSCGRTRDFDLFISYFGRTLDRHRGDADYYEHRPGPKWPCLADILREHRELIDAYETVWFPDDDLAADPQNVDRMFAFFCAYGLSLAQPALTRDSYYTWDTLLQDRRCHIRYTRFVEVMAPIFSREALRVCASTFDESPSGWGLDWVWPTLCRNARLGPIAIIDATPIHHTRPLGAALYRNHPEMDPREDARRLLRRYGIEEVRAVAKYSMHGQVRDVAVPLGQRILYWLKRANGRRKHGAHA